MTHQASLAALQERIAAVNDVLNATSVLTWDFRTMMPSGGAETRGHQIATLTRVARDLLLSSETEQALEAAERSVEGTAEDSAERRMVQQTRVHQVIVDDHIRGLQTAKPASTDEIRRAWTGADQIHDAPQHRLIVLGSTPRSPGALTQRESRWRLFQGARGQVFRRLWRHRRDCHERRPVSLAARPAMPPIR